MLNDLVVKDYIKRCREEHREQTKFLKVWIKDNDVLDYINSRYSDSESFRESLYRFENNIEEKPTCPVCGEKVKFKKNSLGFCVHCSSKCSNKDVKVKEKIKKTNKERYGCENPAQNAKVKEKIKKTNKEKYGCENPFANEKVKEKIKQTNKIKYGCENPGQSKALRKKREKTNKKKFGCKYPAQNKEYLNKMQETCMIKFGCKNPTENASIKEKVRQIHLLQETKDKMKATNQKKYGVEYYSQSNKWKRQVIETKRKNHTFNTSKPEEKAFEELKDAFGEENVLRQYSSVVYPFNCDFYIKSLDLYIELNFHWTHGGHPFNPLDEDDLQRLKQMKNKSTKFYNNAIEVWLERDPLKIKTAVMNHLNYIMFYAEKDFNLWISAFYKVN